MKVRTATWSYGLCLAALGALGCAQTDRDLGAGSGGTVGGRPVQPGGSAGAGQAGGGGDVSNCEEPRPGPSPLLRLNRFQLGNTLRDLFQDVPAIAELAESEVLRLPAELPPFLRNDPAGGSEATPLLVEKYHELAHGLALRLSEDAEQLQAFIGCDPNIEDELTCRAQFLSDFLPRAYRRPLSDEEQEEMQAVFAQGQELGGDFASGVRAVVEVVLQGPDFLYLVERGSGQARAGTVALTGEETAARLAYVLTGSAPDAELRAAASNGPMTAAEVEAHARRLLGGLPSRRLARHFMNALLGVDSVNGDSAPAHPGYTAEIAALSRQETALFIEEVVFDGAGTFQALYAQPSTWLNGPLAEFYGVPGIAGSAFQKVEFADGRRAGILTQSAFLTVTSPGGRTSPVARGLSVLRNVLCVQPPLPPPDIVEPPLPPQPDGLTYRQRLEISTQQPVCQSCHRSINPLGFAFENYDGVGQWRDTDNGSPIDASGMLYETDAQGSFENAVQLVQRIAESPDAQRCFAGKWLSYAYGRAMSPADACMRHQVETVFLDSGGNIVEMLVALASADHFRYRLASELAP